MLCFFLQVLYKLLWSLATLKMIVVVVFFVKNVEEESGSKLFGILRKKQKMPKSVEQRDSCIWLNF